MDLLNQRVVDVVLAAAEEECSVKIKEQLKAEKEQENQMKMSKIS